PHVRAAPPGPRRRGRAGDRHLGHRRPRPGADGLTAPVGFGAHFQAQVPVSTGVRAGEAPVEGVVVELGGLGVVPPVPPAEPGGVVGVAADGVVATGVPRVPVLPRSPLSVLAPPNPFVREPFPVLVGRERMTLRRMTLKPFPATILVWGKPIRTL